MPLDRRIVGSNPALAAMYTCRDLGQVLYLQLPVALRRVNSDTVSIAVVGSASVRSAIEMDKYNTIQKSTLIMGIFSCSARVNFLTVTDLMLISLLPGFRQP